MLQYHYTWGNEDVASSEIKVMSEGHDLYTITFIQEGINPAWFDDIIISEGTPMSREIQDTEDEWLNKRLITLKVISTSNPEPRRIFKLLSDIPRDIRKEYTNIIQENHNLKAQIEELKKDIQLLKNQIDFQPDGPGYLQAKEDFELQSKNLSHDDT